MELITHIPYWDRRKGYTLVKVQGKVQGAYVLVNGQAEFMTLEQLIEARG